MKKFTALLLAILAAPASAGLLSGSRPDDLGIRDGQLKPAPITPNAVNSQSKDGYAAIAPLAIKGDPQAAFDRLKALVSEDAGAKIITSKPDYFYAEYATPMMGFVDDVEFQLDAAAGVVHVRSASRLGLSDLGTNRRRIEALRARF